eukprot:COSAG03_NODE_424_length_8020_cov_3.740184_1_plen_115_part_10
MSSGRSPLLSSIVVLSGPVTLYFRSDGDSDRSAKSDGSVSRHSDWSATGLFASLVETVAALDFQICAVCAFVLCCVVATLLYIRSKASKPNTSTAAVPPVRGEAVVVLDCTTSDG